MDGGRICAGVDVPGVMTWGRSAAGLWLLCGVVARPRAVWRVAFPLGWSARGLKSLLLRFRGFRGIIARLGAFRALSGKI